jgi:hypothetical protein
MWKILFILWLALKIGQIIPIPISIGGQFLTTEDLNPEEQPIIFRRMGEYTKYVIFHHVHKLILHNKINQVLDKATEKIKGLCKQRLSSINDALL